MKFFKKRTPLLSVILILSLFSCSRAVKNPVDPSVPEVTNASISINNNDAATINKKVILSIGATGAQQMMISNNVNFSGASWETYTASKDWEINTVLGTQSVYCKFRNEANKESAVVGDDINFKAPNSMSITSVSLYTYPALISSDSDDSNPDLYLKILNGTTQILGYNQYFKQDCISYTTYSYGSLYGFPLTIQNPSNQHSIQVWDYDDISDDMLKSYNFTPWNKDNDNGSSIVIRGYDSTLTYQHVDITINVSYNY